MCDGIALVMFSIIDRVLFQSLMEPVGDGIVLVMFIIIDVL